MRPTLSLSTSWCSQRHKDGYAMACEMADLGFSHIELSHGIRITLVPGILRALEEGKVRISSTHNFCPLPTGVLHAAPNIFQPSSPDIRESEQWVRQTKRSIDFAAQVGSDVLVCHLGSVRFFFFPPSRKLESYLKSHPDAVEKGDPVYKSLLENALATMRKRMGPFWERTQEKLRAVLEHAAAKKVRLALENREAFEELPLDADFPAFLAGMPPPAPVGYWHDSGHAQIKSDEGVINHEAQLKANADRLIGFHLHDVSPEGNDHQPVGAGKIDFHMVSSFWRPHHKLVLELSPRATQEDVEFSRERLGTLIAAMPGA